MKKTYINRHGQAVELDLRDGEPVPDGFGVRVPSYLVDGVPQAIVTDADPDAGARAAYEAHKAWLSDSWRPQPYTKPKDVTVEAAREEYRQWLTNAWKATGMTPVGPEPWTYPRVGGWVDRNPQKPPPDVRMDAAPNSSEQAYREMVRRQSNAWRGS